MQHPPLRASYASTSAGGGTANQARHAQPHSHTIQRDEPNGHDKVASASTALDRVLGLMDGFEVSTSPTNTTLHSDQTVVERLLDVWLSYY